MKCSMKFLTSVLLLQGSLALADQSVPEGFLLPDNTRVQNIAQGSMVQFRADVAIPANTNAIRLNWDPDKREMCYLTMSPSPQSRVIKAGTKFFTTDSFSEPLSPYLNDMGINLARQAGAESALGIDCTIGIAYSLSAEDLDGVLDSALGAKLFLKEPGPF